jgi:hypothetical protein
VIGDICEDPSYNSRPQDFNIIIIVCLKLQPALQASISAEFHRPAQPAATLEGRS